MISPLPEMFFQIELLIRSIEKYSNGKPAFFSVVVNGRKKVDFNQKIKLEQIAINNKYLSSKAEFLYCPYYWTNAYPSRWFITPKADMCVFIDADMLACSDLQPLYELPKDTIHGATTFKNNHISRQQWQSIGFEENDMPYYFNFGMVVCPSAYLETIGNAMLINVHKMLRLDGYFGAQIALAYTIKELGLPRAVLPKKFNWYNTYSFPNNLDIIFLHFLHDKPMSLKQLLANKSEYSGLIKKTIKNVYLKKSFL